MGKTYSLKEGIELGGELEDMIVEEIETLPTPDPVTRELNLPALQQESAALQGQIDNLTAKKAEVDAQIVEVDAIVNVEGEPATLPDK